MADAESGVRAATATIDSASMVRDLLRSRIEESNRLQGQLNDAVARLAELSFVLEEKEFELKTVRMSLDAEQKRSGMYEEELRKMQQLYQQVLASASHRLPGTSAPSAATPTRTAEASPKSSPSTSATSKEMKARSMTAGSEGAGAAPGVASDTEEVAEAIEEEEATKADVQVAGEEVAEGDKEKSRQMSVSAAQKGGCYSGWMYKLKLGKRFKQTWKRRYFTLTDTHIHYYVSPSDPKPKGSMAIICLTVSSRVDKEVNPADREFCFSVVEDLSWLDAQNDQRRNYLFATDTEDEQKTWIALLKAAKSKAHKTHAASQEQ